jgi:hypothetical protein
MALPGTVISTVRTVAGTAVRLPLRVAGMAVGTVTSHLPGRSTAAPDEAPTAPSATTPATRADEPPVAKKAPARETSAAAEPGVPVEPSSEPVTEIDARAETEQVDVTPADIAPAVGTDLAPDTPTLAEVADADADADKAPSGSGQ